MERIKKDRDMKEQIQGSYVRGTAADTEDILDFADMVFSMEHNRTDFVKIYPKAYAEERRHIPLHHMIKEGNKIRALVDIYPLTLKIGSHTLKAAYVGTVSVHPNSRGKGYMITLMEKAQEQALNDGFDIMLLDGDRHRYQHFGFESVGIKTVFSFKIRNVWYCCNDLYPQEEQIKYRFELLEPNQPDFEEVLDKLYTMYQHRIVTARSREEFWWCLQSEQAETYAVYYDKKDILVGYLNISKDWETIEEFEVTAISQIPQILYCFMDAFDLDVLSVCVGTDELGKIEYLDKVSKVWLNGALRKMRILNYKNTLKFLMEWKQNICLLQDGEYCIGVIDSAQNMLGAYQISVTKEESMDGKSRIFVQETDTEPDIVLEEKKLIQALTTNYYFHLQNTTKNPLGTAPAGWFPLPFYLPNADAF